MNSLKVSDMKKYIGVKIVEAEPMTASLAGNHLKRTVDVSNAVVGTDGEVDGYLVRYADGYESWSPLQQFIDAYRRTDGMSFGLAIEAAKKGLKIARKGWNGKGIFCAIQTPDANSKMTGAYIYIDTTGLQTENPHAPKNIVPWLASQTDILADDYFIV